MAVFVLGVAFSLSCGDRAPTTPTLPPTRLWSPDDLRVLDKGKNHITWTWSAFGERSDVWRSLDAAFTYTDGEVLPVRHTSSWAVYRWEGLAPGTTAYLRVRAVGEHAASEWSRTVRGVTDDE